MSESNPRIECGVHGRRTAAYICTHLARGKHKGFNLAYDPETPDALFPDAWCDKCEALLDQEGEWNEAVENFTKLKLICSACYESARDKHWIQDDEAFEALVAAGFADLETAIFRELGTISDRTPVAATVHSCQLVADSDVVIEAHDSPLDMVATERELVRTGNRERRPAGVDWDRVRPDQFENIPFLASLRDRLVQRRKVS